MQSLALETGLSLWTATGEAVEKKLVPPRAVSALRAFRELIEDARAMIDGTFVERAGQTALATESQRTDPETRSDESEEKPPRLRVSAVESQPEAVEGFRAPGGAATLPEVLKFLIDRTGYIKQIGRAHV